MFKCSISLSLKIWLATKPEDEANSSESGMVLILDTNFIDSGYSWLPQ